MWHPIMLLFKRNPEKDLTVLRDALVQALGPRLKSVVLFGSRVRGDFDPKRSDINVLVVSDLSYESLRLMGPAMKAWAEKGQKLPVLVAPEDLDDFARDFPIEFLDMKDNHRVVHGENLLTSLQVDVKHLESEIEHDLALLQLKLRQALVVSGGRVRDILRAVEASLPSLAALLRATLRLEEGKAGKLDKMQIAERLAERLKLDARVASELFKKPGLKEKAAVESFVGRYLSFVEGVLAHLRKK